MNEPEPRSGAERSDLEVIGCVRAGDAEQFEALVIKYQPRIFATARKYARRESEVEDIVQEVFLKAYSKLHTFRGESPFEHWLMRLAVRTCYDFLRAHQKSREQPLAELTDREEQWLERVADPGVIDPDEAGAARALVHDVMARLSPEARLVLTLLELEERPVKEISRLTGWSVPLVKVRAFRARAALRKILTKMDAGKYL